MRTKGPFVPTPTSAEPEHSAGTRVCILATPDSQVTPVSGFYECLRLVAGLTAGEERREDRPQPFEVEIVAERTGLIESPSGLALTTHRSVDEVAETDVVIVPSMELVEGEEWERGRYPRLVQWLQQVHERGGTLCAACTGGNLIADTGLLDGHQAAVPWGFEQGFRRRYPEIELRTEEVLVISGDDGRLITSGQATAYHDLALHLIAKHVGPATAQAVARFNLWQWHQDGQAPFQVFDPPTDHGDAAILAAQRGIDEDFATAAPVEEMVSWSGLAPRTFKRRFTAATGHTPIADVRRIRVERAKRLLESSDRPVEDSSWAVGYEDPASSRRLFKRVAGVTPSAYRQRFQIPVVASS
jgi:transcriptional regulator GlxA family with amidase domain